MDITLLTAAFVCAVASLASAALCARFSGELARLEKRAKELERLKTKERDEPERQEAKERRLEAERAMESYYSGLSNIVSYKGPGRREG